MTASRRILLFIPLLLIGCNQNANSGSGLATVKMQMGGKPFTLEVADTNATRQYGLMRRDSMPADHGMIFVFKEEAELGFYMKDTRIALDILYIDRNGKIVSIKQMQPYDRTSVPSDGPVQYAIELNKGTADKLGLKAGQALALPAGLQAKD